MLEKLGSVDGIGKAVSEALGGSLEEAKFKGICGTEEDVEEVGDGLDVASIVVLTYLDGVGAFFGDPGREEVWKCTFGGSKI